MVGKVEPIELGLMLIRENFASPEFQATMELQVAARTDTILAAGLTPIVENNHRQIHVLSKELFPLAAKNNRRFEAIIDMLVLMFQGEVFELGVFSDKKAVDARLELLEYFVKQEFA